MNITDISCYISKRVSILNMVQVLLPFRFFLTFFFKQIGIRSDMDRNLPLHHSDSAEERKATYETAKLNIQQNKAVLEIWELTN